MKPSKGILIAGGVAVAAGAIWYIKKSEKAAATPSEAIAAPVTYASSQEGYGNFGNFGGGGAPSSGGAPGTVTTPPVEHAQPVECAPGSRKVCNANPVGPGISPCHCESPEIKLPPQSGPPHLPWCPQGNCPVPIVEGKPVYFESKVHA